MGDESGVGGEGRVVGVPKFHSWGKCTMPLMNINSDWMSNDSSGLCINLHYYYYLRGYLISHLGVKYIMQVLYFASWGVIIN